MAKVMMPSNNNHHIRSDLFFLKCKSNSCMGKVLYRVDSCFMVFVMDMCLLLLGFWGGVGDVVNVFCWNGNSSV